MASGRRAHLAHRLEEGFSAAAYVDTYEMNQIIERHEIPGLAIVRRSAGRRSGRGPAGWLASAAAKVVRRSGAPVESTLRSVPSWSRRGTESEFSTRIPEDEGGRRKSGKTRCRFVPATVAGPTVAQSADAGAPATREVVVTLTTVENHLGRVYIKLGVSGRRGPAVALRGEAASCLRRT